MRGIVLAGGTGSRLWPITKGVSKQLLPVYDKPLIYYPIGTLFLAGIREILIITTPEDLTAFQKLLGDGSEYGAHFEFAVQKKPKGIAEAFLIGKNFIGDEDVALILGDNIFYGVGLGQQLMNITPNGKAHIFAYEVSDPERYGVVEFGPKGQVLSIEEKPEFPKSNYAVPGLYFFGPNVVGVAEKVEPSLRDELEITTVIQSYLEVGNLDVVVLERGTVWLDTGTPKSLNDASNFVRVIEERSGLKIACLEEIAIRKSWIDKATLLEDIKNRNNNEYYDYVRRIID
jgi:glucose-1-phosphate thymidylyltransferase